MSNKISAKLFSKHEETSDVTTYMFRLETALEFVPGQYVMLELPSYDVKRPFSILDYKPSTKELFVGIKKNGEFTQKLRELKLGSQISIIGPYGKFSSLGKKSIFVAGGIGITPIYNMISNRKNVDDTLFFSAQSKKDMPYVDKVCSLNIHTKLFFTRESCDQGHSGRITAGDILDNVANKDEYEYIICGPKGMIDTLRTDLLKNDVPPQNIRSEAF